MRKAAVCNGDRTTTGGIVMAVAATTSDHGRKIALDGEHATCGTCEGTFRMVSSCTTMSEKGRAIMLDGDAVLCPCQRNRVIAGRNARVFVDGGVKTIDKAMRIAPVIDAPASQDITPQMPTTPAARRTSIQSTARPEHPPARARIDQGECDYLDGTRQRIDAPARFYDNRHKVTLSGGKPAMATIPGLGEIPATVY
ncbi:PAAR domain-containing protein [Burkholderia sp. 22PA0099]|uniref:PAAR domain-containing protein n=1 Tax=Burkholderia sp. 22PA0099 TaxID=3237372 RepID=UPI0039C24F09